MKNIIMACFLSVTATLCLAEITTLTPSDDAYIYDGAAGTSYGDNVQLAVKTAGSGFNRRSFLKFNLSGVAETVGTAVLRLRLVSSNAALTTHSVSLVSDDSWDESVTWNTQPTDIGAVLGTQTVYQAGDWVEFVLDAATVEAERAGDQTISLLVKDTATDAYVVYHSSEADPANHPQLVIGPLVPSSGMINFNNYPILSYGGDQDVTGTAVIEDDGATLHLTGNVWKCIAYPYTITPGTVLEFDFQSSVQGEEHAIGMDADLAYQQDNRFKLYGTQTSGTNLLDFNDYTSYAPDTHHYVIPIGQYYTGSKLYLLFVNDHDVASPTAESVFSNVRIYDEYRVVDDFDYELNDATLIDHWTDGSTNSTGSSISEYLAFYLKMAFDNTQSPYVSEVQSTFDPVQDWEEPDKDLTFWYLGDPNVDELYVTVSDSAAVSRTVRISDPAVTQTPAWTEVRIPLADFSGLDFAQIAQITLGIGPESPSGPGGSGFVGFDEIRIEDHQCDPALAHLDLDPDCTIDLGDIRVLAEHWLLQELAISAASPNEGQLLMHYALDETGSAAMVSDSSGNGHHAAIEPAGFDPSENRQGGGIDGSGCIDFDGQFWVEVPQTAFAGIDNEITIAFWQEAGTDAWPQVLAPFAFTTSFSGADDVLNWDPAAPQAASTGWNHYAFVKNAAAGTMRMYENGVLMAQTEDASGSLGQMDLSACRIGVDADMQTNRYFGKMDDFRVYAYALTQSEIVYLATGAASQVQQPLVPLEIAAEPQPDGRIDLKDFALIASEWLNEG